MKRPQRVAVIGVSHWHSAYDAAYLAVCRDLGLELVGVSDPDLTVATERANAFGSTGGAFADYRAMVERTRPEFVIALGRHIDMPSTFRYLLDTGIPFMMEKPWGVDAETVQGLARLANERGAWVAAPFMTRYSWWAERARQAVQSGELGTISHIVFRMIRPTMQRYLEWGSPWMLEREPTGGGALVNLGSHGFDIFRFITGEEPEVISATLSNAVHGLDVEDYAFVTLRTPGGIICHNEVGYTMPTWPVNTTDAERKIAGALGLLRGVDAGVHILGPNRDETIPTPAGYVGFYRRVMLECLDRIERNQPPPITADDCARAVTLIHDAYRIAR